MAAIVNARDVLLQAAASRTTVAPSSSILLSANFPGFHVAVGGAFDPASVVITARLFDLEGTVTFVPTGCTLSGTSGNTTNVTYANMPGATASIVATLTIAGVTITSNTLSLTKVVDGAAGTSGTSVFVGTIYKQQVGAPTTPSGGTFNFNTQTLTPPSGWTVAQPTSTTTPTWAADYTFSTATPGSTVTAGSWGAPRVDVVNGGDGLSVMTLEVYFQTGSAPSAPAAGAGSYTFSTDTFSNTGMTSWSRTLPASSTTPTYRSAYTFSTSTPSLAAAGGTWSTPVVVAQNGAPGGTGTTGARGAGHFYATGSSWTDAAADAATPGANVTDDVVTISNGSTFVSEKRWSGSAWVSQTVVLDGSLLVPGTVAASAITAAQLSALSAFLGAVEIATSGSLRSGQTAYNTGTGFWLGLVSGVAKFSIGSPSGARMTWDGSVLTIAGETKDTFSVTLGGISAGSYGPYTNGTTQTIGTKTSSVTGGSGSFSYSWVVEGENYDGTPGTFYASGGTTSSSVTVKAAYTGPGGGMWITGGMTLTVTDNNTGRTCTASAGTLVKFGTYTP